MYDYAVHPDLLVYWTGRDIDDRYDRCWYKRTSSETRGEPVVALKRAAWKAKKRCLSKKDDERTVRRLASLEAEYLARLRSILNDGLWMNVPRTTETGRGRDSELRLRFDGCHDFELPRDVPRVCFTELRLSQVRTHARLYGRLGIGVKRPFVMDRGGRPVVYCGTRETRERDVLLCALQELRALQERCKSEPTAIDQVLAFLKPMHKGDEEVPAQFYAEYEWRIVHSALLAYSKTPTGPRNGFPRGAAKRCSSACVRAVEPGEQFMRSLSTQDRAEADERLEYLLPLDGWLSCIIYPSASLKARASADSEIRRLIKGLKDAPQCRANEVERGNMPVEIDLDLCRNL